jgi:hypothetical protein
MSGNCIMQLVRDVLLHLNLQETLLVFDAEVGYEVRASLLSCVFYSRFFIRMTAMVNLIRLLKSWD